MTDIYNDLYALHVDATQRCSLSEQHNKRLAAKTAARLEVARDGALTATAAKLFNNQKARANMLRWLNDYTDRLGEAMAAIR